MNLLDTRTDSDKVIEGRFVKHTLEEAGRKLLQAQGNAMTGMRSAFWQNRSISVTDNVMKYQHLKQHRYLDMRTRAQADGTKTKKKSRVIHNKIVMGHYAGIVKELSFGFTDAIKQQFAALEDKS